MRAYYFGCPNNEAGHFLFKPRNGTIEKVRRHEVDTPERFFDGIDAVLAPKGINQRQSHAALRFIDGFTAIALWDRSVDSRFDSNAAFLFEGKHSFEDALHFAREFFPAIVTRIEAVAPIRLVGDA